MCYSAMAVANYFIKKSKETSSPVSNMHLQKMLFFAHAAYFKQTGMPLFSDPVVAWQHGPVVESIYHALKKYRNGVVTEMISRLEQDQSDSLCGYRIVTPTVRDDDAPVVDFLNYAWAKLHAIDTWRLRMLSHAEGGAWYETISKLETDTGKKVDPANDDEVRNFLPRNLTILDSVIKECGR